ncbi:MAG: flagellar biosynthetic protein FliO [Terracidiphilus sp.]
MERQTGVAPAVGGWAGWLWRGLRRARTPQARLTLLERIALAPRQTLALVEADGRRFLVATSPEGSPAFLSLEGAARPAAARGRRQMRRVSW